jgi:hypothetical protein
MRIAITGHRRLPTETERLVGQAIREQFAACPGRDLVGVSNLADGADQLFARAVLAQARDRGVPVTVIWPDGASRDQAA